MKRYVIVDESNYVWCQRNKFGFWGTRQFSLNDKDWEKEKVKMILPFAIVLWLSMRLYGLNVRIRQDEINN